MRNLLIALAAALALSACGSYHYGTGSQPSPSPSEGPGLGFAAVVTETDKTATVRVGQKLEVALKAGDKMDNWSHPRSSNESILAPTVNPAATAVRGTTLAAFIALAPGQAELSAYASPHCPPGSMCPMYVQVWSVKVTVTA